VVSSASVDASYILGVAYIQTKNYSNARVAFAKMFQVPPDSAAAYLFTARLLLRLDFGPIAEDTARKPSSSIPNFRLPINFLVNSISTNPKFPKPPRNSNKSSH